VVCLQTEGYRIAGESARLQPEPDLATASVLIFDADAAGVARTAELARPFDTRLVGLIREASPERVHSLLEAGLSAVLLLRALTPARLLSCVRAVGEGDDASAAHCNGSNGRHLTQREFDVLCLLADGDTTRDIATRLCYSERTVKNIVHDLLAKMNGRTRAHAVALAARQGVI
jgi:DNA-binding NarL/FixJ family response regulator